MGCFLECFRSSKDRKRRNQRKNKVLPRDQRHGSHKPLQPTVSSEQDISSIHANLIPEVPDKHEEQLGRKVTFDTNVRTYEPVLVRESTELLPESNKDGEKQEEESSGKSSLSHSLSEDDSFTSRAESYPPNHRYQNGTDSDDEIEEFEWEDSDLDGDDVEEEDYGDYAEDDNDIIVGQEVWTELIPTALMESSTEMSGLAEREVKTIGSNRNARDRSVYVHPVLNPVENLTQWKAVKSKGTPPFKPQKENFTVDQETPRISFSYEPTFKQSSFSFKSKALQSKNQNQEIAVDASLSNWLVSSETTSTNKSSFIGFETITSERSMSQGSNSVMSIEDRPILGALTMEELKQFSVLSSPKRSPSRSPDEMPIIGTVGTYWSHTGPAKDSGSASSYKGIPNRNSKYREVFVK